MTGASPIAGTGVFVVDAVPAGTAVLEYAGHAIAAEDAPGGSPTLPDGRALAPDGLARLVNHSCDPSTGWSGGLVLVALRDLEPGEEVTVDHATCVAHPAYLLRCHCETYRCRQMVEGTDWRIPQLQRRYAGHWTPYVGSLVDGLTAAG